MTSTSEDLKTSSQRVSKHRQGTLPARTSTEFVKQAYATAKINDSHQSKNSSVLVVDKTLVNFKTGDDYNQSTDHSSNETPFRLGVLNKNQIQFGKASSQASKQIQNFNTQTKAGSLNSGLKKEEQEMTEAEGNSKLRSNSLSNAIGGQDEADSKKTKWNWNQS